MALIKGGRLLEAQQLLEKIRHPSQKIFTASLHYFKAFLSVFLALIFREIIPRIVECEIEI